MKSMFVTIFTKLLHLHAVCLDVFPFFSCIIAWCTFRTSKDNFCPHRVPPLAEAYHFYFEIKHLTCPSLYHKEKTVSICLVEREKLAGCELMERLFNWALSQNICEKRATRGEFHLYNDSLDGETFPLGSERKTSPSATWRHFHNKEYRVTISHNQLYEVFLPHKYEDEWKKNVSHDAKRHLSM